MKTLTLVLILFLLTACSLLNPSMCRYAEGPGGVTITADVTGGSVVATLQEGKDGPGRYLSYPAQADGSCAPPALPTSPATVSSSPSDGA